MFAALVAAALIAPAPAAPAPPAPPAPSAPPGAARALEWVATLDDATAFQRPGGWWNRLVRRVAGASPPADVVRPWGIEATPDVLWVCDPGAGFVHGFRLADSTWTRVPAADAGLLESPIDAAVDAAGRLHVTDSAAAVVRVFTPDGKPLFDHQGGFGRPTGIAYHPGTDRLYVVDTTAHRVCVQSPDGERITTFGTRGSGPGELNFPVAIDVDGRGDVWVTDAMNFRVQVFAPDGTPHGAFGRLGDGTGDFASPKGLVADRAGHVWVVDARLDAIQAFAPDGTLLLVHAGSGSGRGQLWLPTGIAIDAQERLWVADSRNGRVQAFRLAGVPPSEGRDE